MKISNWKQDCPKYYVADDRDLRSRRRYKRVEAAAGRWRRGGSVSTTPLSKWKFHDGGEAPVTGGRGLCRGKRDNAVTVSARKLGAAMWRLMTPVTTTGGDGVDGGVRWQWRPLDWFGKELHSSLRIRALSMEGASKWDYGSLKLPEEARLFCGHSEPAENQQIATITVAPALQVQLMQAQKHLQVLETARRLWRKKLKHSLRKLNEERDLWLRSEHKIIRAVTDALKDELKRERRYCQKMKIVNSNLLSDLANANILAKRFMRKCEKERKVRVFLEDVSNELVEEVGKDNAETEALKSEFSRMRQEVEEERRVLQMAEVWREERVQTKLVDVKLILEEKYAQMNNLIADLEEFFTSGTVSLNMTSEVKGIIQVFKSMNIQEIKEMSYTAPKSDDISTVVEDLKVDEATDGVVDQCLGNNPSSHASESQSLSLENPNGFTVGDTSCRETVTYAVDPCSSYAPAESDCSVNKISREGHISSCKIEHELLNAYHSSLNSQTSEIPSISVKETTTKGTSSYNLSIISANTNGEFPNASHEDAHDGNASGVQSSSPGPRNPHIARAMRGCIEHPRRIQRSGLKAKLLKSRLASQRTQLQTILKQKS